MFRRFIPLLAAVMVAPAIAHQYELGKLVIGHPWSRPTAAGMPMGVAYLSITNNGSEAETLISASSPAAASVQFHQTTIADGMARMRPLAEITVAPGATVKIEPGGIHLMLVDLKAPLEPGKLVPLTLVFRKAGAITVQLAIEARDAPPAAGNATSESMGVVTVRSPSARLVHDARLHLAAGRVAASLGVDNLGNERYSAFHPCSRRTRHAEDSARL